MRDNEELKEVATTIKDCIPKKNMYEQPFWQGMYDLIIKSNYARRPAEVEISMSLPPGRNEIDEMLDDAFDGVIMESLKIANIIFGSFGKVTVEPYNQGLASRSMKIIFKL